MSTDLGIVEALKQRQAALGEGDGPFAERLGVDRETWRLTRVGKKPPSFRTVQGAIRAFPDLVPPEAAALFLPTDAKQCPDSGELVTEGRR